MTRPLLPALTPATADRARKEFDLASEVDRHKLEKSVHEEIRDVLALRPFARLCREGVGDAKFSISVLGSSATLGLGWSAKVAWHEAWLAVAEL